MKTLPEALESAAQGGGGYTFVEEGGRERFQPYSDLLTASLRVAGALREAGLRRGDRAVLVIPDAEPFLTTFLGAVLGGIVPVPIYPPLDLSRLDAYLHHVRHIVRSCDAAAVITTASIRRLLGVIRAEIPSLRAVLVAEQLDAPSQDAAVRVSMSDPVFIQFTSGSTSAPKGVVLTHQNLVANVSAIAGAIGISAANGDVGVSWLPLFHDMGLIGMALGSIYLGMSTTLLPPRLFIKRPIEWLRAISRHRGTLSFAPNFAYALCIRRVKDAELAGLDLSSWRVAGCGAEPIHAATLVGFAKRFAKVGFREAALLPCYGMAEHTLAITFPTQSAQLHVDTVDAQRLRRDSVAVPCDAGAAGGTTFVCCGRPFPSHSLRIVDSADRPLPDRCVGEIVLQGPSVMPGYEGSEPLTRETLRGGWLHTGDLGYTDRGELYVCGRKKDLIIVNGRNYYPQDIEWALADAPGVRRGSAVAFGTTAFEAGGERIVVVVESKGPTPPEGLASDLRRRVSTTLGLRVHEVVIAPPGTVSKTSSGKPQRAQTRARYEDGSLLQTPRGASLFDHLLASQWGHLKAALRQRLFFAK